MPLVRISLRQGKADADRRAIGQAVHRAMVETISVPAVVRFQVITEHSASGLVYDRTYLGIPRSDDVVILRITLNPGWLLEHKRVLYARIAALLAENPGGRPQDALINLVEVPRENWSFGNGEAQYAA